MMKNLKTELWKATHNSYFYIALAIGCIIVLINVVENAMTVRRLWEGILQVNGFCSHDAFSLFLLSLPYNGVNYASRLYLLVWPVLAAMPYAWSYSTEKCSGLYNQILSRCNVSRYLLAKYIAMFVSGGVAVALPFFVDLLLNALICPYAKMDVVLSMVSVFNGWFMSELYYELPWVHALIWCVVVFLLGGAVAGLSLVVGTKFRLQVLVVMLPFSVLMVWNVVVNNVIRAYFGDFLPSVEMSPLNMIRAAASYPNPEWVLVTTIGLLVAIGIGGGYWQVKYHELV